MTEQVNLGGAWRMREADSETWHSAHVPGSVYADLMADGTMPDPFWRENELDAFERMKKDYVYQRTFTVSEAQLAHVHVELVCEGLDTLAHVSLNGREIAFADNMHITWVWDVKEQLHAGENTLEIRFDSPILYCAKKAEEAPGWESSDATPGFRHLRKAHCMFGWDWGPRLPDAGIWRPIFLRTWFLQTEYICIYFIKKVKKALCYAGSQSVYIPRYKFLHINSPRSKALPTQPP